MSVEAAATKESCYNKIRQSIKLNAKIQKLIKNLKSASNLNGNLNCSKELEHYAS